ncbi:MAG: hypothetical protein J6W88_01510 [Bacteroidales bacterium]|nr:hypothetical protein [Bacteroidales bacterium]
MQLCIFNPEHDLCLAKGRAHYVPPRSAVEFARQDAGLMQVLYPDAICCSVYDVAERLSTLSTPLSALTAWGWDAVVKYELIKRGVPKSLLPSDDEINTIRELQHRSTVLPLQPDCHEVRSIEEMEGLLREREHWVMKAPWSGAGRGLRWVHGSLTAIDRDWLLKTVASQRCVIAEPRRDVVADVALEYCVTDTRPRQPQAAATPSNLEGEPVSSVCGSSSSPKLGEGDRPEGVVEECVLFIGYSYFKTGSGVYKENILWPDERIEATFSLLPIREQVERWLEENVWLRYRGPLGVDLMVCADGSIHVSEINFRHTMGMVAHEQLRVKNKEL